MYKKSTQKIINRIIFIVIIFAILCGIGIYILKYEVQGETNIPFEITKIAIAQSVNGIESEGHQEKWNFNVSENNDIYIYLEKNSSFFTFINFHFNTCLLICKVIRYDCIVSI